MYQSGILPYPITGSAAHQVFKGFKITFQRDTKEALRKCHKFETESDKEEKYTHNFKKIILFVHMLLLSVIL